MTAKKKKRTDSTLELNGTIYFVERDSKGKETRHKIDGKLVLQLVLVALEKGLKIVEGTDVK